jgi:phage terminase large subunit
MLGFSTDRATSVEGFHAPFILWILDEAKGLPKWVYTSMEGSFTGGMSRVLEISTTDGADQTCQFRQHHEKARDRWNVIHFSAMDSPFIDPDDFPQYQDKINKELYKYGKPEHGTEWPIELKSQIQIASKEWLIDRLDDWGEREPLMVETKVWGEFSTQNTYNVIPLKWVESAINAKVEVNLWDRRTWASDIAREGNDKTVLMSRKGRAIDKIDFWEKRNTMETTGMIRQRIGHSEVIGIDADGVGSGVFDRLAELGQPTVGLQSARAATEGRKYLNLRAQMWWEARDAFYEQWKYGNKLSIPDDPELIEELTGLKYSVRSDGLIQIEAKKDAKKPDRLGRSPDKGDTCVYLIYVSGMDLSSPEIEYDGEVDDEGGVFLP